MRLNLFEGIKEKEIQLAMRNIHNNLNKIVEFDKNHHAYFEHAEQDDEYLQSRIQIQNLRASTSYYSIEQAKQCTYLALKNNWEDIQRFLLSMTEYKLVLFLMLNKSESIGYGYLRYARGVFENCHACQVVLSKNENASYGFFINTTYPVITRDLVADETVEWKGVKYNEIQNFNATEKFR